MFIELLQ